MSFLVIALSIFVFTIIWHLCDSYTPYKYPIILLIAGFLIVLISPFVLEPFIRICEWWENNTKSECYIEDLGLAKVYLDALLIATSGSLIVSAIMLKAQHTFNRETNAAIKSLEELDDWRAEIEKEFHNFKTDEAKRLNVEDRAKKHDKHLKSLLHITSKMTKANKKLKKFRY